VLTADDIENMDPAANRAVRRVLVVDDDDQVRRLFSRILQSAGYETLQAANAERAHDLLRGTDDIDLMIADIGMPGESGIELVRRTVVDHPSVATMVVSGYDDPGIANTALENGAYGYLTKPVRRSDLIIAVLNALRRGELEAMQRGHTARLERAVAQRTASLEQALERLEDASHELAASRDETIQRLARALEYRDTNTAGHVERMASFAGMLAGRLGLDEKTIQIAAALHDVGKLAIPDSILLKPGALTPAERAQMQTHAQLGHDLLAESRSEILKLGARIALTHHERVDGTGYPQGLAGEDIPIEGRIAAIADVFDALTSDRSYRPKYAVPQATAIMREGRGTQFDAHLLDEFFSGLPSIVPTSPEALAA
jgi:putative two-component system response regulator